jgi:hypothetical protein
MITEKKLLSDCGNLLIVDDGGTNPNDHYSVKIAEGPYLIIEMGGGIRKAISKFSHPNIIASRKKVYEFKHYRSSGSKFWTSQAGVSHYLIVPKDKIYMLPEKGYSWIPAEINGVKVRFNVSGGGGSGGWTDFLGSFTCISVNHKLSDAKKIAEVAIRDDEAIKVVLAAIEGMDNAPYHDRANELERWEKMAEKASPDVNKNKEKLLQMIEQKVSDVKIVLNKGYAETMGVGTSVVRSGKKERLSETSFQINYSKGRCRWLHVNFDGCYPKRVRDSQISWVDTVKQNANLLHERHGIKVDNAVMV